MPSKLTGLKRALTWDDFTGKTPADDPEHNAQTDAQYKMTGLKLKHTSGGVTIDDTIVINVVMNSSNSWARDGKKTTALLNHEQGHYDIAALMARDFFIDLMQLKSQTFSGASDLQSELTRLQQLYVMQPVSDTYDAVTETNHGRDSASQTIWDGFFRSAFTTPRVPEQLAPDDVPYKVTLRKVLLDAGKIK